MGIPWTKLVEAAYTWHLFLVICQSVLLKIMTSKDFWRRPKDLRKYSADVLNVGKAELNWAGPVSEVSGLQIGTAPEIGPYLCLRLLFLLSLLLIICLQLLNFALRNVKTWMITFVIERCIAIICKDMESKTQILLCDCRHECIVLIYRLCHCKIDCAIQDFSSSTYI